MREAGDRDLPAHLPAPRRPLADGTRAASLSGRETTGRADRWRRAGLWCFALGYAIFFFRMTRTGFRSWFSSDDLLNLYFGWSRPLPELLRANVQFVNSYYRPFAELVYYVTYSLFGFNPAPFNVIRFLLGAANVAVLYGFVSRLARSREAGAIAVLLAGFHPSTELLFVDTGMIFDALAFFFYFSALGVYLKCRNAGRVPGGRQIAGILILYILALNSKEIAVNLPVALLLVELTVAREPWPRRLRGLWQRLRAIALAGVITLAFLFGKETGPGALLATPGYQPVFSWAQYMETYARYAEEFLLYVPKEPIRAALPWVLGGCVALAMLTRRRALVWASLFNLVAILPIAFIEARNGFAFVVPLAGWAAFLAELISWMRETVTPRGEAARLASQAMVAAAIGIGVLMPYARVVREVNRPAVHVQQDAYHALWKSAQAALPARVSGRKILILHDPMVLAWGSLMLIQLGYNDPGIVVDNERRLAEKQRAVVPEAYDYVFDTVDGKWILKKPH